MYLDYFKLTLPPFGITPNPAFFYSGNARGEILDALLYAVTHGEGIIKVTGEVGSGKTMLCRMLAQRLPQQVAVIYLVNPSLGAQDVLYAIAGELNLPIGGKRPDELLRLLHTDLIDKHAAGRQVVLLVEEAQAMPLATLEEIRLLTNLETAHHKLLQIVLFGQPELDDNLNLPEMRQLKERITHSFSVPLMPEELIPEFLACRLAAAGYAGPPLFDQTAVGKLAAASQGIVRRINILADKALLAAFAADARIVGGAQLQEAIGDSEFIAPPRAPARKPRRALMASLATAILVVGGALAWALFSATSLHNLKVPGLVAPASTPRIVPGIAAASAAIAPPAAPGLLRLTLADSKTWLKNTSEENLVLQIMIMPAGDTVALDNFLAATRDAIGLQQVHAYPWDDHGEMKIAIVYGDFSTQAQAQAVQAGLSGKDAYRPQILGIRAIRAQAAGTAAQELW